MRAGAGYKDSKKLTYSNAQDRRQGRSSYLHGAEQQITKEQTSHMVGLTPPVQDMVGAGQEAAGHQRDGQEYRREEQGVRVEGVAEIQLGLELGRTRENTSFILGFLEDLLDTIFTDHCTVGDAQGPVDIERVRVVQGPADVEALVILAAGEPGRDDRVLEEVPEDLVVGRHIHARELSLAEHTTLPAALPDARLRRRTLARGLGLLHLIRAQEDGRGIDTEGVRVEHAPRVLPPEGTVLEGDVVGGGRGAEEQRAPEGTDRLPDGVEGPAGRDGPRREEAAVDRRVDGRRPAGGPAALDAVGVFVEDGAVVAALEDGDGEDTRDAQEERPEKGAKAHCKHEFSRERGHRGGTDRATEDQRADCRPELRSALSEPRLRRGPGWGERIRRERKQYFTTSSSFLTAAAPRFAASGPCIFCHFSFFFFLVLTLICSRSHAHLAVRHAPCTEPN